MTSQGTPIRLEGGPTHGEQFDLEVVGQALHIWDGRYVLTSKDPDGRLVYVWDDEDHE